MRRAPHEVAARLDFNANTSVHAATTAQRSVLLDFPKERLGCPLFLTLVWQSGVPSHLTMSQPMTCLLSVQSRFPTVVQAH